MTAQSVERWNTSLCVGKGERMFCCAQRSLSAGSDPPGWDVTALLHEGAQWEPERIEDAKVIGGIGWCLGVFGLVLFLEVPLVGTEPTDQEQDHAHPNIGKHNTHPDLIGQRVQEGENAGLGLLWLLYHNGDAQAHKGLGKVYHLLSNQSNGERCNSYICSLETGTCTASISHDLHKETCHFKCMCEWLELERENKTMLSHSVHMIVRDLLLAGTLEAKLKKTHTHTQNLQCYDLRSKL